MDSKIIKKEHYWVITYEGDTSGLMPGPLPEILEALNSGAHEIILNLSGLRYLSPNGIKALKESLDIAKKREVNIGVAAPPPHVRRALKLAGLVPDIPIFYSEREAITGLELIDYQSTARKDLTDRLLVMQKNLPIAGHLRDALRMHPTKPHFRMIPCRDVKRGLQVLLEERVDCIVVDASFALYQITGFIEKVETDQRLPSIPILVVATDDKLEEAELLIRNGADEILRFPFKPVETVVRLQTLISHMKDHRPYHPPEKVVQPRGWKA